MKSLLLAASLLAVSAACCAQGAGKLSVTFIDVEGGQATLFVTPEHQSLLIDTGWGGHEGRDAKRIADAAHKAGLSRIDFVLITHYHEDHVGGVPQLVDAIPVGTFIDHGANREMIPGNVANYETYQKLIAAGKYNHIVAKPGEHLPIAGMDVTVISADGNLIAQPLPFAGSENQFCGMSEKRAADTTENSRSLGVEITFGKLKILDLGDLTWDKEMELMCPSNRLGTVDVLIVSHHGWNQSSSPALVEALHPRVAVMDNGATKGGSVETFRTLADATAPNGTPTPLWQLHFSEEAGTALNRSDAFVANPHGTDAAYSLVLMGAKDGSFTIANSRTGKTTAYVAVP